MVAQWDAGARRLFAFVTAVGVLSVLSAHHAASQLALYGGDTPPWLTAGALVLGAAGAALVTLRRRHAQLTPLLAVHLMALLVTSALFAISTLLFFHCFPLARAHSVARITAATLLPASLVVVVVSGGLALLRTAVQLGYIVWLANPFRLLGLALAIGAALVAAAPLGHYRVGLGLALLLGLLAAVGPPRAQYLLRRRLPRGRQFARLGYLLALANSLGFYDSTRRVAVAESASYDGEILFAMDTRAGRLVMTQGAAGPDLFLDDTIRVSSLDQHRYYEALVRPALNVHRGQHGLQVLLLFGGTGLAAQQILAHEAVAHLTVVLTDGQLWRLARRGPWLDRKSQRRLEADPRLEWLEAEPLPWLTGQARRFDVIISDTPPPLHYVAGKYYTRYFYEQLGAHLLPAGVVALPATSPSATPSTYCSTLATLHAAGFVVAPYASAIPTLGSWAFALATATEGAVVRPATEPAASDLPPRYFTAQMLEDAFDNPPRCAAAAAEVALLHEQGIVEDFLNERGLTQPWSTARW